MLSSCAPSCAAAAHQVVCHKARHLGAPVPVQHRKQRRLGASIGQVEHGGMRILLHGMDGDGLLIGSRGGRQALADSRL